ncbi:phosphotransferase [Nocardioides sp.]|uniref:phosphotransferase family protein n=1 Tax=Nocardioides sp. TaxID=35761 RepID=UPI00286BA58A|nr:phosphotransferase [Nocardioides sp.]
MDFASLTPLEGGWSGQTFLAEAAGERHVVRIYAEPGPRGDQAHEVDAALLRLVRGLVPVADVLEVRRGDPATGMPALLVTSLLPGERGDLVLPRLDDAQLAILGREVGALAATLGAMPQLRAGPFVDGDLRIGTFGGADGLDDWVRQHEPAFAHWSDDERTGLLAVAEQAQVLLDSVGRHCLVHSDLNPKNLLVDPETLQITGLVDWEFAHAGHPFTDLGNVLRFDRQPAYVDAVLAAYGDRHDIDPTAALDLARAADLWALVDLASRHGQNPVADWAEHLLRAIANQRNHNAWLTND